MWWEQFFWVVYGIGSTLFVFFLFKLGNAVAGNREESIEREIGRSRRPVDVPAVVARNVTGRSQDRTGRASVGSVVGSGDTNTGEAFASVDPTQEFLVNTGGFHADSGVRRQADQGHRVP